MDFPLETTQILGVFGLVVASFLAGRLSAQINCCRRINVAQSNGLYSTKFYKSNLEHTKLILCARTDLKMGKGKVAAQCSHATIGVVNKILKNNDQTLLDVWKSYGQPKIVTKVNSLDELEQVRNSAHKAGIPTYTVCDAGKTQVLSGSFTVLAVGPAPDSIIDPVTRHLKLM